MSWFDWLYAFGPPAVSAAGIVLSLTVGGLMQRRHLADIARRHAALADLAVSNDCRFRTPGTDGRLVVGEAVISAGYLRSLLAKLKKLVGGELRSYHVIMFRAREEAVLRMLEQAPRRRPRRGGERADRDGRPLGLDLQHPDPRRLRRGHRQRHRPTAGGESGMRCHPVPVPTANVRRRPESEIESGSHAATRRRNVDARGFVLRRVAAWLCGTVRRRGLVRVPGLILVILMPATVGAQAFVDPPAPRRVLDTEA